MSESIIFNCSKCAKPQTVALLFQCEEKVCSDCFIQIETKKEQDAMNFRTPNADCLDCGAPLKENVHERQRSGKNSGTCVKCWHNRIANSDEVKAEIAREKAAFDAKSVRDKMFVLLDEIDSCQDAMHPSSLKGYHNCLKAMKMYAQRRSEFKDAYEAEKPAACSSNTYLWDLLFVVEEIAEKYENDLSLENCKRITSFIEGFSQMRWAFENA